MEKSIQWRLDRIPKITLLKGALEGKKSSATGKGSLPFYISKVCVRVFVKVVANNWPLYGRTMIARVHSVSDEQKVNLKCSDLVLIRCYLPGASNTIRKLAEEEIEVLSACNLI